MGQTLRKRSSRYQPVVGHRPKPLDKPVLQVVQALDGREDFGPDAALGLPVRNVRVYL